MRWIAACGVMIATLFSSHVFSVQLEVEKLFLIGALLLLSNIVYLYFYKRFTRQLEGYYEKNMRILVLAQIIVDLVLLTFLLHYAGGVENPFIIYYVFHLMVASIILPRIYSYAVATFMMMLVGIMAGGEYLGWFRHYSLEGFITFDYYNNLKYLAGTGLIFISTSYVVVYLTGTVSSKLRKKELAYRQANQELLEKDKIKNEYVFRITHDIKGHIAAIKNCLDATFADIPKDKKDEFISRAYARTERLIVFIQDLLRITQLRLRDTMIKESFSLTELISEIVEIHRDNLSKKNIHVHLDIKTGNIFADRISMAEVFDNLLSNSIKYMNGDGDISIIALKKGSDKIHVEFSDTGMGIPQKDLPNIFEEFYIASNNQGSATGNTGMGLAIVRKIIKNHNGSIQVNSKEGAGTTFLIRLPGNTNPK